MKRILSTLSQKWPEYLLEILVLIIGIYGAFALDEWKEERNDSETQTEILIEIRNNLIEDLDAIQDDLMHMDTVRYGALQIIEYLKNNDNPTEKFKKDIAKMLVTPHFDPNVSGYKLLVSKGVAIIHNDSLRQLITKLFESTYSYYNRYEEERIQFRLLHISPGLMKYSFADSSIINYNNFIDYGEFEIYQSDYESMKKDEQFKKLIYAIIYSNEGVRWRAKILEKAIKKMIAQITEELNQE
ncbi:DUF6090 family protein [Fulvivirga lutea]|uniref:Uncharacterized protein n=1 Tax=Fulvivirga lutea TaxID=2810512 RepID=A0A975A1W6_9BACT|nr:DUF6090 family protein [Fulvivirga lutea]QSE98859.1 hypothetical protein JR347_07200 [Fulvivirga lutea]